MDPEGRRRAYGDLPIGYHNLDRIARPLQLTLRVATWVSAVQAGFHVLYAAAHSLGGARAVLDFMTSAVGAHWVAYYAALCAAAVAAVLWLVWQYLAGRNAELLVEGLAPLNYGRHSIWWWFVPIVNFVFPYQAVVDHYRVASQRERAPVLLKWWTAVVSSTLIFVSAAALERNFSSLEEYTVAYYLTMAAGFAVNALAAVYAVRVVKLVSVAHRYPARPASAAAT